MTWGGRKKAKQPSPLESLSQFITDLEVRTGHKLTDEERAIGEDETFRQWCERLAAGGLKVDGKPFRLDNRPALIPIYDAIPSTRAEAKDFVLVIQKATQLGLSILETLAAVYMSLKWEPVSIGMFMPAQATAIHKSEHRFMRIVRSAPELYSLLTTGRDVDGSSKKVGEGNVLTRRVKDSLLLFLWTSGKVTTESVPMDVVTLDEVQEMPLAQIDKVMARMGDSDVGFALLLSTANMPDLDINFWYQRGTQEVWHTECPSCGALSDLSDPAGVFPEKSIGYNNGPARDGMPERDYYWRCPACSSAIPDAQVGRYVSTAPGAPKSIRSFLLPRTISPKMTPRKMIEAWGWAKTADQKKSFYNRTLARPYIDADQLPVTMAHCEAAVEAGRLEGVLWETKHDGKSSYFCGIDQMGGFNAVIVKKRLPDGRQAVVHVEAIFNNDPFARCSELMEIFNIQVCVVEQLPNVNDARRFANRHRGRVYLAGYADLRDDSMVWGDAQPISKSDQKTSEDDRSRYTVTLNQYKCMQTALYRIRGAVVDGKLVPMCLFPDPAELEQDVVDNGKTRRIPILREWVFHHFTKTALVIEQDEEQRKPKAKVHKVGIDPHYSYANMLCDVGWARNFGTSFFILPKSENERAEMSERAEKMNVPGLPAEVIKMVQEAPPGRACGNCASFDASAGMCVDRMLKVAAKDMACILYSGPE